MTNIILCGGNGTRLWPISRTFMPKQFVKLFNDKSLFQLTVERNSKVCDKNFIVSNAEQYFLAKDQLEEDSQLNIQNSTLRIQHSQMEAIASESIDYAVMEKSDKVKVVPSNIDWSDVGSFDALYDELPKDKNGNTSNINHISCDSKNNLIYSIDKHIATIDVEDLIIVDAGDALLISKKSSSQKVKEIVKNLKINNSKLTIEHLTVYRPWGTYTVLEDTPGYKIKRIEVKPGKRLSLQKHYHRNEHWIVVSGTATVTVGDEAKLVRPNESTYIKMGEVHRLANDGKIPVVLIEAQVGEYTGEDDIVRLDDDFNRN